MNNHTAAYFDNQVRAIEKLGRYKVGALFMDPGTGKTRAAYELIKSVTDVDYILYIAPYQAINSSNYDESILAEIDRCGGFNVTHDVVGFESISSSDHIYVELYDRVQSATNPFIICDESLKIKNSEAKRTERIIELGDMAEYKLVLNGTPLSKNLLDLWPQFRFLSPKILQMSEVQFKNIFVEYTVMKKRIGNNTIRKEWINKYHNLDYLFSLIGPFVFEASLDLDVKVQHINVDYNLTEQEESEHDLIKGKYLDDEYMEIRNNNIFIEITQKLQHNYSRSPEKYQIVRRILSEHDNSKVAICAKYIDTQKELKEEFPDIRILSWQKNAFALNLQQYNVLIKFDKHWDYALHQQLMHRIYREGQNWDCLVYDLTGNVGLETMMNKNIEKKGSLLDAFKRKSVKELQEEL